MCFATYVKLRITNVCVSECNIPNRSRYQTLSTATAVPKVYSYRSNETSPSSETGPNQLTGAPSFRISPQFYSKTRVLASNELTWIIQRDPKTFLPSQLERSIYMSFKWMRSELHVEVLYEFIARQSSFARKRRI